jgi:hypothetical protein
VAEISRAAAYNEAKHHLRRAAFSVGNTVHCVNVKISWLLLQGRALHSYSAPRSSASSGAGNV